MDRRLVALLLSALVLAGACSASTDGDDADGGGGTTTEAPTGTEAVSTFDYSGVPTQGVTEDSVRLGVANVDAAVLEEIGIEGIELAPTEALFAAWIDELNADGGVNGRRVELAYRPFIPYVDAEAEAACVELAEDQEVFLAIGILLDDGPLCLTETQQVPYLGLFGLSPEREERSIAPFFALEMSDDRQKLGGVDQMIADGAFTDRTVGLVWDTGDTPVVEEFIQPALEEAGVDVVVEATREIVSGTDQAAADQEMDVMVERLRAADPDVILNVSDFGALPVALQRNDYLPDAIYSTSAQGLSADVVTGLGLDETTLEAISITTIANDDRDTLLADEGFQACLESYAASDPAEPIADDASYEVLSSVAQSCSAFQIFVQAAEAAGDDLTPASWAAGAESLGELDLPGLPFASLSPIQHSAGDAIATYAWDAAEGRYLATGDPIDIG